MLCKTVDIINSLLNLEIQRITKIKKGDVVTWTFHLSNGRRVRMRTEALVDRRRFRNAFLEQAGIYPYKLSGSWDNIPRFVGRVAHGW